MRSQKRIAMSAILAAPLVGIAVLATMEQPQSTKLAKFTEPARLKAADGGVADGIGPADVHQGLTGFPSRNGFLPLVVRQFRLAAHYTTPRALARFLPSPVRLLINSRSNSARPPRTVSISRP